MTEAICSLECTNKPLKGPKTKAQEFVAPVKIVLVDTSPKEHCRNKCNANIISVSIFCMGFVVMTTLAPTLSWDLKELLNVHIIACTLGFQLILPIGMYMMNPVFGPAVPLSLSDRRSEHIKVQFMGLFIITLGGFCVTWHLFSKGNHEGDFFAIIGNIIMELDIHGYAGLLAGTMSTITLVSGFCAICTCRNWFFRFLKLMHMFIGVLCFVVATFAFVTGLLKPYYWESEKLDLLRPPIAVCVIYNFFVIIWAPLYRYCACG